MRHLILTIFTTGLMQLTNLGSGMLAAHLLAPAGRGELQAAILWPTTLAYLLLFGLNDASLYWSAQGRHRPKEIFAAGLWLGGICSAAAMLLGWFVALPLAYADFRPEVRHLAGLLMLLIPLHIYGNIYMEMLRGHQRMTAWNVLRVSLGSAYLLLILGFVLAGRQDVESFGLAYLGSHLVPMALALALCLAAGWGSLATGRQSLRDMFVYGARLHPASVVSMLNSRVDQLLIAARLEPAQLGLYVAALALSQVTATLANSVAQVAFPRACAAPDEAARAELVGRYLRLTLVLMVSSTLVLWVLAPLALRLMFGRDFAEAAPVVRVLVLGVLPLSIKEFFILAFKASNKALAISANEIATLALNAGLLALLVPTMGLMGAAIAFVAVRWASALYLGWLVKRQLGYRIWALFVPTAEDMRLLREAAAKLRRR